MDDQNPGVDGASEGAADLELEPATTEGELTLDASGGEDPGGNDPLDDIQDEVARAEAKKWRAIARREERAKAEPKPEVKPAMPTQEFVTKADFHKANERKAILEFSKDPEIKAKWSDIVGYYTPRRGKETAEDIIEDIKDALTLYKARNPEQVSDDSALALSASTVVKSGGGSADTQAPKLKDPPNFKLPTRPHEWYPKKS